MDALEKFDEPTRSIIRFVRAADWQALQQPVRQGIVRHILDSIGCALFAFHEAPCVIARELAAAAPVPNGSSVIGLASRTTPEYATFANGGMIRYLDYNDSFHSKGYGHPSDMIGGLLAVAEEVNASGADFALGVYTAYEVFAAIADRVPALDLGWDAGLLIGVSTAAGAAKLLDLPPEAIGYAVSLTVAPSVPLAVTRTGRISPWRGFAAAHSAMNAVFGARLARRGMLGPDQPFDGIKGLTHKAVPRFSLGQIGAQGDGRSAVQRSHIKLMPADYEIQAPAEALLALYQQGLRAEDIKAINIRTYHLTWEMMGGGQGDHAEKWDPKTRETADHSLPYLVAVAITDGVVNHESFSPARFRDPGLRPVMQKVTVQVDPEIEANWAERPIHKIEITLNDGSRREIQANPARGHATNPATDADIERKFLSNAAGVTDQESARRLAQMLWRIEALPEISELTALLRRIGQ